MEDMEYEYLLRAVYKCGRGVVPGADANYYREMEHAQSLYELDLENIMNQTMRLSTKSIGDLKYDYERECRKVWSYVSTAISKLIEDYGYQFTNEEIVALKKVIQTHSPLNKKVIYNAIETASDILVEHGIYAG